MDRTHTKVVLGFFIVSLLFRLSALLVFPESPIGATAKGLYLRGAHILVEGDGFRDPSYPVFNAPPLYAMIIAVNLYLFGDTQVPVKIVQAFADSVTVIVVYLVAKQIFNPRIALLCTAMLSIYPFSIYAVTYIGTETFFTMFLSIFVLLSIYAVRYDSLFHYMAAGIALGLATLTRGGTQFYPLFFLLVLVSIKKASKSVLLRYLAFCLSFGLVILPWAARNYIVLDDFIPVATGGSAFLQGSSEKFFTVSGKISEYPKYFDELRSKGIEAPRDGKPSEKDKFLIRAGLENYRTRLRNNPASFVPFLTKKFLRLWYATESGRNEWKILIINMIIYPFFIMGVILARWRKNDLTLVLMGLLVYFVLLHWVTLPLFRYMVPVMPYAIMFSAFALLEIGEGIKLEEWFRARVGLG